MVTRLLDRREYLSNPKAVEAVGKEIAGLQAAGTWDISSVREKDDIIEESRVT